ncbi:lipopolysaccharide core heptose(II) kinase RfaY [Candidatus Cetobacterium colombiensis]|uniref:Lipopolysaccharide core heptose(II) kinase RfaY n=1 Tax=Candidatus Cetobacterium colombiensis TaxID=3073100 RepID=A0ABU4W8S8_9FUSO|nr:lipopolysaccharide core heptose(II) kinase RfaY [Candidatus Cetobacterium colombiensis]MDX8335924.1 lipopolysaccharide core heptose(II) kinase RfaY [Candidatus Cetobacterium colombiensis]
MKKQKLKNGYILSAYEEKYLKLGEKILENKYNILKEYKNTLRNYVAVIEIENKKYVLKSPRNEHRIIQRKVGTLFKDGEALTTLKNINELIKNGLDIFAKPYLAIVKRKNGFIEESFILMEYVEAFEEKNKDLAIEYTKKMHEKKIYHGDCNPANFVITGNNSLKVIDTQAKKMFFGKYRAHYDMLTMKMDSYREVKYPYKKDCWYYMALGMKKFKKNSFIKNIKSIRKRIRNHGEEE